MTFRDRLVLTGAFAAVSFAVVMFWIGLVTTILKATS